MIKKIIHIADVHIPNDCSKRPYGEMIKSFLKQLYVNDIQGNNPSDIRIVIVGDIFHNKIRASNEARAMFHEMLNYLNEFCVTYVVAGNHDMLENNRDRTDSLAPTFGIENVYGNVKYLDKELGYRSGLVEDDNVVFALFSMHDSFASPFSGTEDFSGKTVVGLYHGDIAGAVTDVRRVCDDGIDTSLFKPCDCVMCGHIHRFQDIKKNGVHMVYPGSVFQQGVDENTSGHGYVVWDIPSMDFRHVEVDNCYRTFKFRVGSYTAFSEDIEEIVNL